MSDETPADPKLAGPKPPGLPIRLSLNLPSGAWLAVAAGAVAVGAITVGAVAIGAMAIGRLSIGRLRVRRLEVGELTVRRVKGL
jgi:hypothetical protein